GLDRSFGAVGEDFPKGRTEQDTRAFGADGKLHLAIAALGTDIEATAAHQRIAGQHGKVEEELHRVLRQLLVADDPAELDALFGAEQAFDRGLGLLRVDLLAKTAGGAECEAEEL